MCGGTPAHASTFFLPDANSQAHTCSYQKELCILVKQACLGSSTRVMTDVSHRAFNEAHGLSSQVVHPQSDMLRALAGFALRDSRRAPVSADTNMTGSSGCALWQAAHASVSACTMSCMCSSRAT